MMPRAKAQVKSSWHAGSVSAKLSLRYQGSRFRSLSQSRSRALPAARCEARFPARVHSLPAPTSRGHVPWILNPAIVAVPAEFPPIRLSRRTLANPLGMRAHSASPSLPFQSRRRAHTARPSPSLRGVDMRHCLCVTLNQRRFIPDVLVGWRRPATSDGIQGPNIWHSTNTPVSLLVLPILY